MDFFFVTGPYHNQKKTLPEDALPLSLPGGVYRASGPVVSLPGAADMQNVIWWPDRDVSPSTALPIAVGEPFTLDEENVGDCSGERTDGSGIFVAFCVLDEGHAGQHVATDGVTVVETWD